MTGSDFVIALLGGLVGGSVSAFMTWFWTNRKWKSTAHSFKTTARYLVEAMPTPNVEPTYDEDGWLVGLRFRESVEETVTVSESVVAKLGDGEGNGPASDDTPTEDQE